MDWHDTDQAKAIAYERWLADHCHSCGVYRPDWLDEKGKELEDPPFEVIEYLCPGCQELGWHMEEKSAKEIQAQQRRGIHLAFRPVRREEE